MLPAVAETLDILQKSERGYFERANDYLWSSVHILLSTQSENFLICYRMPSRYSVRFLSSDFTKVKMAWQYLVNIPSTIIHEIPFSTTRTDYACGLRCSAGKRTGLKMKERRRSVQKPTRRTVQIPSSTHLSVLFNFTSVNILLLKYRFWTR